MADALNKIAVEVQFTKIVVLAELALLDAEIAFYLAWRWWFPGLEAWFLARVFMHRTVISRVLTWLAQRMAGRLRIPVQMLGALTTSFAQQLGLVFIAQQAQISMGTRKEHDNQHYKNAAVIATVGSMLAFGGMFGGPWLKKLLGDVVVKHGGTRDKVEKWFDSHATKMVAGGSHEFFTEMIGTLILEGKLVANPGAFTAGASESLAEIFGGGLATSSSRSSSTERSTRTTRPSTRRTTRTTIPATAVTPMAIPTTTRAAILVATPIRSSIAR